MSVNNLYDCHFCGTSIDWECKHDEKGNIWSCDKCTEFFCTSCFHNKTGEYSPPGHEGYKEVLCPDCFNPSNIIEGEN